MLPVRILVEGLSGLAGARFSLLWDLDLDLPEQAKGGRCAGGLGSLSPDRKGGLA